MVQLMTVAEMFDKKKPEATLWSWMPFERANQGVKNVSIFVSIFLCDFALNY
jgi:hypothetical protein